MIWGAATSGRSTVWLSTPEGFRFIVITYGSGSSSLGWTASLGEIGEALNSLPQQTISDAIRELSKLENFLKSVKLSADFNDEFQVPIYNFPNSIRVLLQRFHRKENTGKRLCPQSRREKGELERQETQRNKGWGRKRIGLSK
ncbi:MAG: hypothetical protein M1151_00690 [Candidatus Thermoplasmatota archaeon]|nr:hypothetical protein [Candidatus Thermoplasmatota archaeon]MCL5785171.1 hypothetical protein [Candidatus Thermoplasmatota archaeon]